MRNWSSWLRGVRVGERKTYSKKHPNLMKQINPHIQESKQASSIRNIKKTTQRYNNKIV